METKFLEEKIRVVKDKTIRFDRVNIELWEFKVFISFWIWTGNIERLFIQLSDIDEEGVYVEGVDDRDDMELFFSFNKQSDETDSGWEEISVKISNSVTNQPSFKLPANVLVLNHEDQITWQKI